MKNHYILKTAARRTFDAEVHHFINRRFFNSATKTKKNEEVLYLSDNSSEYDTVYTSSYEVLTMKVCSAAFILTNYPLVLQMTLDTN
jgi:hypothetical protein